jgi:hypothetical protein
MRCTVSPARKRDGFGNACSSLPMRPFWRSGAQFACFTSTQVQILTHHASFLALSATVGACADIFIHTDVFTDIFMYVCVYRCIDTEIVGVDGGAGADRVADRAAVYDDMLRVRL